MPEPTTVASLYGQQQQQIKALAGSISGGEDLLQNMMCHLLPNSNNLFKNHRAQENRWMGLLRVATQDAIPQLSSQTSVQVDVDLGDDLKVNKVVDWEEFEDPNRKVFEKCESARCQGRS
ncbi:hypothetical protein VNO77_43446 [Canavalia gladiata]|uniref:Uncharacterized protein n=1 Tax=Canavalia gladiata TaxID=3824 RepID=A0AAN9PMX5_CANGL